MSPGDYEGLPSPEMLEAIQGYTLLRTDEHGWVHLTTDGARLWVGVFSFQPKRKTGRGALRVSNPNDRDSLLESHTPP